MKYRMDLDGVGTSERPRLVGLWIEGFSWIVGGNKAGEVTITGDFSAGTPPEPMRILRALQDEQILLRGQLRANPWPVGRDD